MTKTVAVPEASTKPVSRPTKKPAKTPAKKITPPAPAKPTHSEVVATWQDWMDATKRAKFVGRRLVLPILAAAYICVDEGGTVCVRATDLERFIETKMPGAYIDGPGPLAVNATSLLNALNGIKGALSAAAARCERIRVAQGPDKAITVSGFGRTLRLVEADLPVEDFPAWPPRPGELVADLPAAALVEGFGFAEVATGRDDTLPMLTGVKIEADVEGRTMRFVATDRYRLAVIEVPSTVYTPVEVLVPRTAWPVLRQLRSAVQVYCESGKTDGSILFVAGNVSINCRLMDATFPPFRSLIPTEYFSWTVDRAQLIGDVTAAAAVVDSNAPVRIMLNGDKYQVDGCEIHLVTSSGVGDALTTGFNPDFLLAGLKSFTAAEIDLLGTTANKPFVLRGTAGGQQATYLQMPTRLP